MVLILSEEKDKSTNEVIRWLDYYGEKWVRINQEDILDVSFTENDIVLSMHDSTVKFSEIRSFWYRRGAFTFGNIPDDISDHFKKFLNEEHFHIKNYLYYLLHKKRSIGSIQTSVANKLINNDLAKRVNLKVPESYLLSCKSDLERILKKHKTITKVIAGNGFVNFDDSTSGVMYTTLIENTTGFPEKFAPSYFQEYIEKRYELRIFYLKEKFYAMAIFSQKDSRTRIDFRKYNRKNPNRNVPYLLPKNIEKKLLRLMELIKLDCASIDMLVSKNLDYYFLEVNPVGQFGMVSYPCHYKLEKRIAKYLIEND